MDGGAWCTAVHGVAKSRTGLSDFTFTFHFHALEKEMATHSCTLAWKIPWTKEHGGLQSTGSQRVGQDRATSLSLSLVKTYLDYTDLCKAMSLIYNMLFIFVIAFLTRSKHLLLSWLQ